MNCYGGVIILGVKENKDGSWRTTGLRNASKLRKEFWDNMNNPKQFLRFIQNISRVISCREIVVANWEIVSRITVRNIRIQINRNDYFCSIE